MLKINHISKTFNPGTVNAKLAVSDLSLELNKGDFVTIIGSNGAGKSTLFNAIAGVFYVDEGSIWLDGKNITYMPEYKRSHQVGRLFQDPLKGTAPGLTIEENAYLPLRDVVFQTLRQAILKGELQPGERLMEIRLAERLGVSRTPIHEAIRKLELEGLVLMIPRNLSGGNPFSVIRKKDKDFFRDQLSLLNMGLEDRMKQPVGLLSGGQRQALTLLMATLVTPKLLLLDEHTAALDPGTASKVLELTKNIVEQNQITCLMITHNMRQALELGNRTLLMSDGNIVLDVQGEERNKLTKADLLARFKEGTGKDLDNDRILLSH